MSYHVLLILSIRVARSLAFLFSIHAKFVKGNPFWTFYIVKLVKGIVFFRGRGVERHKWKDKSGKTALLTDMILVTAAE